MRAVSEELARCKDCDAVATEIGKDGWHWLNIVEDEVDPVNGWRCPVCCAGWKEIIERGGAELH